MVDRRTARRSGAGDRLSLRRAPACRAGGPAVHRTLGLLVLDGDRPRHCPADRRPGRLCRDRPDLRRDVRRHRPERPAGARFHARPLEPAVDLRERRRLPRRSRAGLDLVAGPLRGRARHPLLHSDVLVDVPDDPRRRDRPVRHARLRRRPAGDRRRRRLPPAGRTGRHRRLARRRRPRLHRRGARWDPDRRRSTADRRRRRPGRGARRALPVGDGARWSPLADGQRSRRGGGLRTVAPIALSTDQWFVVGDRTDNAVDSRMFGPISRADLVGRAGWIVWPSAWSRLGRAVE